MMDGLPLNKVLRAELLLWMMMTLSKSGWEMQIFEASNLFKCQKFSEGSQDQWTINLYIKNKKNMK